MEKIYYKVISAEGFSPTQEFDYRPYLPTTENAGDWLPEIPNNKLLEKGYYVSQYWNMWYESGARIYIVDVRGVSKADNDAGVEKQICCSQIRLLRDVTDELLVDYPEIQTPSTIGKFNTGSFNTGNRNTGNYNTGNFNTGNSNTGNLNRGNFNTGDRNEGIDNVGDGNFGTGNVGCQNIGHSNTGSNNKGSYNSGDANVGFANSGSFNKGNRNSGKWNIGNRHSGFFNTGTPKLFMFNKPVENKAVSDIILPKYLNRPNCKEAFETASIDELKATLKLPNYDYAIFEEITGISRADFLRRIK